MGHKANSCPVRREEYKRQHAHIVEDEEPPMKMIKDHVLISSLSGSISPGEDTWLIDSGASKHMTGKKSTLSCISEKKFSQKVTLGDDYQYPIKGVGESNYKIDSENSITMKDILFVPGLKTNLLSISALDKKGYRVVFIDGEVLMWAKGETINEAIIIGNEENGLYKLKGHPETSMTHAIENSCELWHRRLAHINYKALPYICKVVTGLPELKVDQEGICNGCAQRKNIKNPFPKRDSKAKGVLELIHSDVCGPMQSSSISRYVYCYPRYLGITRRSCLEAHMVLDMEYRKQERPEHGPGGPIFLLLSQLCPVSSTNLHHYRPGLASERTLAP
jgi:hypothetical protein